MIRWCAKVLVVLLLSSCSEKQDFSTPAKSHIDAYRFQMQQCSAATKNQAPQTPVPDVNTAFAIEDDDVVFGDPKAKVLVIEYASPTCAHCAYFFQKVFPELKKNYIDTGKIAYVMREFIANRQDLDATTLAYCGDKDKRAKLLEVFFAQQESWAFNSNYRSILTNIGQLSGISQEQYEKCLDDQELKNKLMGKARVITRVNGFAGTPAFVINGVFYHGEYSYQGIAKAIEDQLK